MLQTAILFVFQVTSIWISTSYNTNKKYVFRKEGLYKDIIVKCISIPLIEELLFRGALKEYLGTSLPSTNIITSLIFGSSHIFNYIEHGDSKITVFQVISTAYLGYYIIQYDNMLHGCLIHIFYNSFIVFVTYAYAYVHTNPLETVPKILKTAVSPSQDDMLNVIRYPKLYKLSYVP